MFSSRAFRLGIWSLAASGVSLLASTARADAPSAKCESTLSCSSGEAALKTTSRSKLVTPIDTGWLPSCGNPDPNKDHCSDNPMQVRANIRFDAPTDPNQSLYEIDMQHGALVDVTWPDQDALTVRLSGAERADGKMSIAYTLVPNASVYLGIDLGPVSLKEQYDYDATTLVNLIPGAHFNYFSSASTPFTPWGFDGALLVVKGPDLSNSRLFAIPLDKLPGIKDVATGTLGVSATTSPTFTYKTTKVSIIGLSDSLGIATASAKLGYHNTDSVDMLADVEGELTYKGSMEVLPVLDATFTKLGGLHLVLPISVGAKTNYDSGPTPVNFGRVNIHVPLPNLGVPQDGLDFGTIQTGSQADKSVALNNTGELGVLYTVESTDPQFSVDMGQTRMDPKSTHDLVVHYKPARVGSATATITVKSNDPDAPTQTFTVKGTSADLAPPGSTEPPGGKTNNNSGCACHVTSLDTSSGAGAGVLGLGVLAFVRRRRRD
jgi:MYXO-CTERM domain-containing protein